MPDSTLGRLKDSVARDPATARVKEELQRYLQARAEHTLTGLGDRLGSSLGSLAESGQRAGGLVGSLAKGGKALGEGKSPVHAAVVAGASHLENTVKDKLKGMFGKGRKSGGGKSKSVTIVEDIDVGVPVREAYDQWTQFQEFSTFAKGVVNVEKSDETTSNWTVKVAKSTRSWKANVTEQIPDERIAWTTQGAKGSVKGVVTFHPLGENLTRVLLVLEYFPQGLFEKTGNIWRAQGRRARLDLKLYRKFIMMRGEATDAWRGEIRDGEVVMDDDESAEDRAERDAERDPRQAGDRHDDEDLPEDFDDDAESASDEVPGDEDDRPDEGLAEDELDGEEDGYVDEADEADDVYADDESAPRPAATASRRG